MEAIQRFLNINQSALSYAYDIKGEWSYKIKPVNVSIQPESIINSVKQDLEFFNVAAENYKARKGFKVGECIYLPDGSKTYITHVHEDNHIQTGNVGSIHLSEYGYASRSGSLDSGLKASDLLPTKEKETILVWFWHKGRSGADRGVYFDLEVNVYKTKKSANLDGIPQIKEAIKQAIIEKSETITRINGNGQEYTMHMPEIIITQAQDLLKNKSTLAGLTFEVSHNRATCQPMTLKQINDLLKAYEFEGTFYNNCSYHNTLILKPLDLGRRYLTLEN